MKKFRLSQTLDPHIKPYLQRLSIYKKPLFVFLSIFAGILGLLTAGTLGISYIQKQWGLQGQYYPNPEWQGPPTVSKIDNLLRLRKEDGRRLLSTNRFSVKWTGWIVIDQSGSYQFATISDDGSFLRLSGQTLVDNGGVHGKRRVVKQITLEPGVYPIEVLYFQFGGDSTMWAKWTPPGENREDLIPAKVLFAKYPQPRAIFLRKGIIIFSIILKVVWGILFGGICSIGLSPLVVSLHKKGSFQKHNLPVVVSWLLLLVAAVVVVISAVRVDFRHGPIGGDEASHLFQALSLAYDGDLKYEAKDIVRWREIGWSSNPTGLFYQRSGRGYAFAKPYGYSLFLAPFIRIFGPVWGVASGNVCLFLMLLFLSIALLRKSYQGVMIPLLIGAFYFASYPYFYIYVIHTELFLSGIALLFFYLVVCYLQTERSAYLYAGAMLFAFAIPEKIQFALLFFPIAFIVWLKIPLKHKLLLVLVFLVTVLVVIFPNLFYSNFKAWTAYSGERYYARDIPHFAPDYPFKPDEDKAGTAHKTETKRIFSVEYVANVLRANVKDLPESLRAFWYYLIGAHTGIFVFLPLAGFLLIGALHPRYWNRHAVAILLGIFAYIGFYVILFPKNYFGGYQSLGNRYFLQMATSILALAAVAKFQKRFLLVVGVFGLILAIVFLWPHHQNPSRAFNALSRTSWLQRWMPLETHQKIPLFVYRRQDPLNIRLIPWIPEWQYVDQEEPQYVLTNGILTPAKIVTINSLRYALTGQTGQPFTLVFKKKDKKVYTGPGFYSSDRTHVWSHLQSSIVMEVSGNEPLCLVVKPHLPGTALEIKNGDNFIGQYNLPIGICLEGTNEAVEQRHITFAADNANAFFIPAGPNKGMQMLSFFIRLARKNEIEKMPQDSVVRLSAEHNERGITQ